MNGLDIEQLARGCAHGQLPAGADCPVCRMTGVGGARVDLLRLLDEARRRFRERRDNSKPPTPMASHPPRYDDVFSEGTRRLNGEGEE